MHALKDKNIDLAMIKLSPRHFKRSTITEESISWLANNIDKGCQIAQLLVRPYGKAKRYYELLAGQRRYLALKKLGVKQARCAVIAADDDLASFLSVSENVGQEPLSTKDRQRAEAVLSEFYTKLFAAEETEEPEHEPPPYKKNRGKDVLSRPHPGGRKKTLKRKVAEAVANELNINVKTYLRDVKRAENLIEAADKALELKRITTVQANELANMTPADQRKKLPVVIRDNLDTKARGEKADQEAKKSGPTTVARKQLEAILFECRDQNGRIRELRKFLDGRDIDYKVLRKSNLEWGEECSQLLDEMLSFVREN